MSERYGSRAADLFAAIGPGIGGCCYDVGVDVADKFRAWSSAVRKSDARIRLDLPAVLLSQLRESGLPASNIETADLCTYCRDTEFHSYRREGAVAGRMVSGARIIQKGRVVRGRRPS
jgi:copper oxidase (laccase) domain-containing protein